MKIQYIYLKLYYHTNIVKKKDICRITESFSTYQIIINHFQLTNNKTNTN